MHPPTYALWKGDQVSKGYWDSCNNQLEFMNWLSQELGMKTWQKWYDVTKDVIGSKGGWGLLKKYNDSPSSLIVSTYPQYPWQVWKFGQVPRGHWESPHNRMEFMKWLEGELGIRKWEDWYAVTKRQIGLKRGWGLLMKYKTSPSQLIMATFPNYPWKPWKFAQVGAGHWDNMDNCVLYLDWLAKELNITHWEDWYSVTHQQIVSHGGWGLLLKFGHSPSALFTQVYPQYPWELWKFDRVSRNFHTKNSVEREYFDWLAEKLQIQVSDDWHRVGRADIMECVGKIPGWAGSFQQALTRTYIDTSWHPWTFNSSPVQYWQDNDNCRNYMSWLEDRLGFSSVKDWCGITRKSLELANGSALFRTGHLYDLLDRCYPNVHWNFRTWEKEIVKKSQDWLGRTMKQLLPEKDEIERQAMLFSGSGWKYSKSLCNMIFDLWIPAKNMAIEYQGEQHFDEHVLFHGTTGLDEQFIRDEAKKKACEEVNVTLVCIPYWWDHAKHSLESELARKYQFGSNKDYEYGLPESHLDAVPLLPGENFEYSKGYNWNYSLDINARWVSLKHNGVRIASDGNGHFYTKQKNRIFPPSEVVALFNCGIALEFELCFTKYRSVKEEEGPTAAAAMITRCFHKENTMDKYDWNSATLYIFDAPFCLGDIRERLAFAQMHLDERFANSNAKFVRHYKLHDTLGVQKWRSATENRKFEGLMLHDSNAYIQGRHPTVLKLKVRLLDRGKVVGYHALHSLLKVELLPDQHTFVYTKMNRKSMLFHFPIGTNVTFYYFEKYHPSGLPKNPKICSHAPVYGADSQIEHQD